MIGLPFNVYCYLTPCALRHADYPKPDPLGPNSLPTITSRMREATSQTNAHDMDLP
jgi:hypothetical protein